MSHIRVLIAYVEVLVQKSKPTSIRLSTDVKAAAEKAAKADVRSLSSLIEKLLVEHLREKGYLAHKEERQ